MAQRSDQELVSWEIIGAELGMTGEGARKIYNQALSKMRDYLKDNPARSEAVHNLLIDRESRY
jgi:DNA-directed RNA polymerase sigma subunit (sigma70/sigma32)